MNHSGRLVNRLAKKAWTLGWGLAFVSIMTILSVVGANYSSHFAVAKSLVSPVETNSAALR
jgi:hypothetical protein